MVDRHLIVLQVYIYFAHGCTLIDAACKLNGYLFRSLVNLATQYILIYAASSKLNVKDRELKLDSSSKLSYQVLVTTIKIPRIMRQPIFYQMIMVRPEIVHHIIYELSCVI